MERYNIAKPKKYTDKSGQEKTVWSNVGTIVLFEKDDGTKSGIIEIPAIGLDCPVFPQKPRDNSGSNEPNGEPVMVEDIPF